MFCFLVVFFFLQKELHFDDELVLQQIRHTGILQMVHIQKSGYNAKYTFKVDNHLLMMMCIIYSMYINIPLKCTYKNILQKGNIHEKKV